LHLQTETRDAIEKALGTLTDQQRTVFVLKHDQGMKVREIAAIMNIGEGTVKSYLFRAVEKLQTALKPYYSMA